MFDVFATILSAGVVISVVTLVVHEPLLLAAGISTILGLMFLLLPLFTTMVPVLGYLLMFTGIVGLGYGVLSTRSWLNVLHARRLQALARRQQLQAARARDDDAGAPLRAEAPRPAPRSLDEDGEDDLPARLAAQIDRDEAPAGKGTSALARVGRRLGPGEPEPESRPAGKPWRNPYDPAPAALSDNRPEPRRPAAAAPPLPAPQPPAPPVAARPAKAEKPLSRGAERIRRIKDEARLSRPPRRVKPKAAAALPPPAAAPEPPPPSPAVRDDASALRARRQRDLMELDLLELDPSPAAEHRPKADDGDEPRGARPFLSRMARRS